MCYNGIMNNSRTIETKYWLVDPGTEQAGLREAAAVLADGGIVAFPTETVYGLGADARNTEAVARIFEAKGRPSDNPLIVHLASEAMLDSLVSQVNELERKLIRAFWPGPLTLVLPVRPGAVSPLVTAGLDTVAVRLPGHDLARKLIELSGCPLAAPSANRSGRPSPTAAEHVLEDLAGRIDGVLDGGMAGIGLESTVVRVMDGTIHILRPGGVTCEQLQQIAGPGTQVAGEVRKSADEAALPIGSDADAVADRPRSPGVKYRHYAPQGAMLVICGDDRERMVGAVREAAAEARRAGRKVGIIACSEHAGRYEGVADEILVCGSQRAPAEAARRLYAVLRECDRLELGAIIAEGYPETGVGMALMNRMRKAAGGRVRQV